MYGMHCKQVLYILDMIQEDIEGKANALDGGKEKEAKAIGIRK